MKRIFKHCESQKSKKKIITKRNVSIGILFILILTTILVSFFMKSKTVNDFNTISQENLRAMNYEQFVEGDDAVYIDGSEGTDDEQIVDNIKFSSFFLRDLDGDGYAEKLKGTCKEIGKEDTLYMEIIVQTAGYLKNAKIQLDGKNFYFQTALPKDNELKANYIGNNIKTIEFENLNNGTQKLLTGIVRSGNYSYDSQKTAAIGNNINNYSRQDNRIILTGIYVDENGIETEISKEVNLEMDWYGETKAAISSNSTNQNYYDITSRINEQNNTFIADFTVSTSETENELILNSSYTEGTIPELNGFVPIEVSQIYGGGTFSYNEETRKFTITRIAETDENGIITNSVSRDYYNKIQVKYPLEAYETIGKEMVSMNFPISVYYEGYNNPNTEFRNPYKSNVAQATIVANYQPVQEESANFKVNVGKYITKPSNHYMISKRKPLRLYNGTSSEEIDDTYEVSWYVYTGTNGNSSGMILKETQNEEPQKIDTFIKADSTEDSMEDITSNVGIYFGNASVFLRDNGEIKVYDEDTGILVHTFTKSDWNKYNQDNPYIYETAIKHVKIVTSETNAKSSIYVYHVKELDDDKIIDKYTIDEFKNLQYIKTNLTAYLGDEYLGTKVNHANYEAPYSIATIGLSKDTLSTQSTEEGINIYVTASANTENNQVEWTNGTFLIKLPDEILDIKINNVIVNTSIVSIDSYEVIENENGKFIKIKTSNINPVQFTFTINADITPDPRIPSTSVSLTLYAINEDGDEYYYSGEDIYDVDGDGNIQEIINVTSKSLNMIAPNSLLTNQTLSGYDENGSIVVSPQIADLKPIYGEDDREKQRVNIGMLIRNNYSSTISEIIMLGKIPFEGNTYVISGGDLHSDFSTNMTNRGIVVPEELQDKVDVYYSINENPSKDLLDENNGWTLFEDVEDWDTIKSWAIDFKDTVINPGKEYNFFYTVEIPFGVDFNDVTNSHHGIFFCLDTPEGKYRTHTEPNKVGLRIADKYNLLLTKYQKELEKLVQGATYRVSKLDDEENIEESQTAITNAEGLLEMANLYAEKVYEIKEVQSPTDYELNENTVKIIAHINRDEGTLTVEKLEGETRDNIQVIKNEGEDYKVSVKVEDEANVILKLTKFEQGTKNRVKGVRYSITGYGLPDSGRKVSTNVNGELTLKGLKVGEEYTLEEVKAEGYYLASPIKFRVDNNKGNYEAQIIEGEVKTNTITENDGIPIINLDVENIKIPTYSLEVTKIKHVTGVSAESQEQTNENEEETTYLQGAKFKLYKDGKEIGTYITDENGKLVIDNLYQYVEDKGIEQTYILKEVQPPDGYVRMKDLIFKVEQNEGVLDFVESNDEHTKRKYTVDGSTVKIILEDSPKFRLIKKDGETEELLANAKFSIYNISNGIEPARNSKNEIVGERVEIDGEGYYVVTTDENGVIEIDLQSGLYKAVEVEAPSEKYNKTNQVFYFGIEESVTNGEESYVSKIINESGGFNNVLNINDIGYIYTKSSKVVMMNNNNEEQWRKTINIDIIGVETINDSIIVMGTHMGIAEIEGQNYGVSGKKTGFLICIDISGNIVKIEQIKADYDYLYLNLIKTTNDKIMIAGHTSGKKLIFAGEEIQLDTNNYNAFILELDEEMDYVDVIKIEGTSKNKIITSIICHEDIMYIGLRFYNGNIIYNGIELGESTDYKVQSMLICLENNTLKYVKRIISDDDNIEIKDIKMDNDSNIIAILYGKGSIHIDDMSEEINRGTLLLKINSDTGEITNLCNIGDSVEALKIMCNNDEYYIVGRCGSDGLSNGYYGIYNKEFELEKRNIYSSEPQGGLKDIVGIDGGWIVCGYLKADTSLTHAVKADVKAIDDIPITYYGKNTGILIRYSQREKVNVVRKNVEEFNNYMVLSNYGKKIVKVDNGYLELFYGSEKSSSSGTKYGIAKLDENKNVEWNYTEGRYGFTDAVQVSDDKYIVMKNGYDSNSSKYKYIDFYTFDLNGNLLYKKEIDTNTTLSLYKMLKTSDGGYLVVGSTTSNSMTIDDQIFDFSENTSYDKKFILKFSNNFKLEWEKDCTSVQAVFIDENDNIVFSHKNKLCICNLLGKVIREREYEYGNINEIIEMNGEYILFCENQTIKINYNGIVLNNKAAISSITDVITDGDGYIVCTGKSFTKYNFNTMRTMFNVDCNLNIYTILIENGNYYVYANSDDYNYIEEIGKYKKVELVYREQKEANDITEMVISNELKKLMITTEVNLIDGVKGGSITGENNVPYELVKYGDTSTKEIKIIPDENYEIISITVNGEEWQYTPYEDGSYTMPQFENVTEDKHIVVTYSLKDNKITINKRDSVSGACLEGAKFKLDQIEEREEPVSSEIIGELTNNGQEYTEIENGEEITDKFGELTNNGTYYFVEQDGKYIPTNSKTYQVENVEGATTGVQNSIAWSYIPIDLTEVTGKYAISVNAEIVSESADPGVAFITENTTAPTYSSSINRFIYINGTQSSKDYLSQILEGGKTYYLHLGYRKDGSVDIGTDQIIINSVKLYTATENTITYNFINNEGKYESSNQGKDSTVSNSYIPIDLTNYTGKYNLTVNAEVSSQSGNDYGYATITENEARPAYSNSTGRFIFISGTQSAKDYTIELQAGKMYYLHFGYYKNEGTSTGDDKFTINSINICLSDSYLYHTEVITNSEGQAITQIPFGKYQVTEINTPEGYWPLEEPTELEFRSYDGAPHEFTIENEKKAKVIIHHYIKGTEEKLADDEESLGRIGDSYETSPKLDLEKYTIEKNEYDEFILPENANGSRTYNDIEVTYFYVPKSIPLIVHHYIEGTENKVPLKDGNVAEDIVSQGQENEEYITEPISDNILDEKYELLNIPENSTGTYQYNQVEVTYYYKIVKRQLQLNKYDEDGTTPLGGVKFNIINENEIDIVNVGEMTNNGTYYFEKQGGKYISNNNNESSQTANSYIKIDMSQSTQNAKVIVNAEISSEAYYDYGYATLTENITAPAYNNSTNRFIYISGTQTARDYEANLVAGKIYYLHFGYRKDGSRDRGTDTFTINNISFEGATVAKTYTTNSQGKIEDTLESGTYKIIEIETLEGYVLPEKPVGEITISKETGNQEVTITNEKQIGDVTVHHYIEGTTTRVPLKDGTEAQDEYYSGKYGEAYGTEAIKNSSLNEFYTLVSTPENAYGTYRGLGETIVNYYYKLAEQEITINKYDEDEVTPLEGVKFEIMDANLNISMNDIEQNGNYYFVKQDEKLVSNNKNAHSSTANSYLKIDATNCTEPIKIIINAEISSQTNCDIGYAAITESTTAPAYNNSTNRFIYISGTQEARDYISNELQPGKVYYLHLGYRKDSSVNKGLDTFSINSIKIDGNVCVTTNSQGQATTTLKAGNYIIKEIETLEDYVLSENNKEITITRNTINPEYIILNEKKRGTVIVHYYIEGTTTRVPSIADGEVVEDEVITGIVKESYSTQKSDNINSNYELATEPENSSGTIVEGTTEVIYYYKLKPAKVIVHHYLKGTETKVADDEIVNGKVTQNYVTNPKLDIEEYMIEKDSNGENILPENKSGIYTLEDQEVNYYYVDREIQLTVHHYIEGTTTKVPLAGGGTAEDEHYAEMKGETYTTSPINNDELSELYVLSSTPSNATGTYNGINEIEVNYYYKLAEQELRIKKYDEDGITPLEGVKFEISKENRGIVLGKINNNGTYYFNEKDGKYISSNTGVHNTTANSYLKIDTTNAIKSVKVIVNAEISSESGCDIGYATIRENTTAPSYNNSANRFMYISGTQTARDYISNELQPGKVYYLHIGYRKDGSVNSNQDKLTINSVRIDGTIYLITNSSGEATSTLEAGNYTISEIETLEDYALPENNSEDITITKNTINPEYTYTNSKKRGTIIIHHYIEGTVTKVPSKGGGVVEDETLTNKIKEEYETTPSELVSSDYEVINTPENARGTIIDGTIEVTYYYKVKNADLNIEKVDSKTNESLSNAKFNVKQQETREEPDNNRILSEISRYSLREIDYTASISQYDQYDYRLVNGQYVPTNGGKYLKETTHNQQANSYISLGQYQAGRYYVVVNAKISSEENGDYGWAKVAINDNPTTFENTYMRISGEIEARDYRSPEFEVDGSQSLYIGIGYTKNESISSGDDEMTVYSIKIVNANTSVETDITSSLNRANNYYFQNQDGKYVSDISGIPNTIAHSMVTLSGMTSGRYMVVVNAESSSEENGDIGYAALKYSSPSYDNEEGRFMWISGETEAQNYVSDTFDYENSGPPYYLVLGYIKNGSENVGDDAVKINSIKLYKVEPPSGSEKIGAMYTSQNKGQNNVTSYAVVPIDLREYIGKYNVNVNAEISSEEGKDIGYAVISDSESIVDIEKVEPFMNISGEIGLEDYTTILQGGKKYYLHLGYKKDASGEEGQDRLVVNSVNIELSDADLYDGEITTDENGIGRVNIPYGKYIITEIKAPEGYKELEEPIEFEFYASGENLLTIENNKLAHVTVHHYIKDTETELGDDVTINGVVGDTYETSSLEEIPEDYELVAEPENKTGTMDDVETVVTYYYRLKDYGYTVKYLEKDSDEDDTNNKIILASKESEVELNSVINAEDEVITIPGYKYDSSDKENITIGRNTEENVITLYYTKDGEQTKDISYTVEYYKDGILQEDDTLTETLTIHILDGDTLDVDHTKINVTDKYEGYTFEKTNPEILPNIAVDGEVIKVYYVAKTGKITINHIDKNNPTNILETEEKEVKYGTIIETSEKDYDGYILVEKPDVEEYTYKDEEQIVNYYYAKVSTGVLEKHLDVISGNPVVESIAYDGYEGKAYATSEKKIEGYKIATNKDYYEMIAREDENFLSDNGVSSVEEYLNKNNIEPKENYIPSNKEGTMNSSLIEVKYYYIPKVKLTVKYVDILTGEEIKEEVDGEFVDSRVNKVGDVDEPYVVEAKEFDKYLKISNKTYYKLFLLTHPEVLEEENITTLEEYLEKNNIDPKAEYVPDNKEGNLKIMLNDDGTYSNEIVVTYYYGPEREVIVKYYDKVTGEEISEEKVIVGPDGENYDVSNENKEIEGYTLVEEPIELEGVYEEINEPRKFYYAKNTKVRVKYVDKDTNTVIDSTKNYIIDGYEGKAYSTEKKGFDNYNFVEDSGNIEGTMRREEIQVIYYYSKASETSISETPEVPNTSETPTEPNPSIPEVLNTSETSSVPSRSNAPNTPNVSSIANISNISSTSNKKDNNSVIKKMVNLKTGDNLPVIVYSIIIGVVIINVILCYRIENEKKGEKRARMEISRIEGKIGRHKKQKNNK